MVAGTVRATERPRVSMNVSAGAAADLAG